jgi:hypothetical protein
LIIIAIAGAVALGRGSTVYCGKMKCIVLTLSLLVAGGCLLRTANGQCHITIIGHEDCYIDGFQQDVTCVFSCQSVASIQWFLIFGELMLPIGSPSTDTEAVLSVNPTIRTNGTQFKCVVIDTSDVRYMETITICVRELEHSLSINASQKNPVVAGTPLTLTCTAVSSRPAQLNWINSDGATVTSTSFITVSQQVLVGLTTTSTLTFDPLKTSHADTYTCSCVIDYPSSVATTTHQVIVQIPPPIVSIVSDPPPSQGVSTGDTLTMTCTAVVSNCVDTPTTVDTRWTDRNSLRDAPRVTVTQVSTTPPYEVSVSISSLISSDTGTYECCAQIHSVGTPLVNDSDLVYNSIDISASLSVEVLVDYEVPCDYEYPSPPYYRPCTPISLRCEARGASGRVNYRWSSTNSASFVSGGTNMTVSTDMLTYLDGGLHTCCAHDAQGNRGCDRVEMVVKGMGLYIDDSEYISGAAVANNSIVVPRSSSCTNCKLDIYCCTDRAGLQMEFVFPDGIRKTTTNDYYNMEVERLTSTAKIRAFNHLSYYPQLYGLYCCNVGSPALTSSVAVYSSLPGPPRVYSSGFEINEDPDSDCIISIICSTSDSPPSKVKWCRNGVPITIDGTDYEAEQQVTDRRNLYYDNVLHVKNSEFAAGRHQFECKINNSRGSHAHTVETNVPVYNETVITSEGSEFSGERHVLTCTATLHEKLKNLLRFVRIEWVGPSGLSMTKENMIEVGGVTYSECGVSRTLTFDPLKTTHSGLYRCILSIAKEELAPFFQREIRHDLFVMTIGLFQLQFGPVSDSSTCAGDPNLFAALESNLKTTLTNAINERCHCDFEEKSIDLGEISYHYTIGRSAVYRARLTATVYTAEQLLAMVQDWASSDGTFLFNYHGRIRLRVNPLCQPLAIDSFTEPECGQSVADVNSKIFPTF